MPGVLQRVLYVDLASRQIGEERLPLEWYRESLGGHGLAIRYLMEDLRLKNPVLQDPILIMTGPLTGYPLPGASKASLLSYRQDTRTLKLSSLGGMFPAYLKHSGFDGVVITGKAKEPVWLQLKAGENRILSALDLWGLDVFTTEERVKGAWSEVSTLTIGPAGENGHLWATLVIDRFINTGVSLGGDFGRKFLKAVAVEADGENIDDAGADGFLAAAMDYIEGQKISFSSGENRRSCLGCVGGCGLYRAEEGVAFFADELERLKGLLPQLTWDQVHYFYQECLRQGLEFYMSAKSVGRGVSGWNLREGLDHFARNTKDCGEGCFNTRSWGEAQLNVHRWYADEAFRRVRTLAGLVERENLAMVRNCLPCCERWNMSLKEMVYFLNRTGTWAYTPEDLLCLGERIIRQTMAFYQSLNYGAIKVQRDQSCNRLLPSILGEHSQDYLRLRGWADTGYPQ